MSVCLMRPLISSNSACCNASVCRQLAAHPGVLGVQVRADRGIVPVAQPVVVVHAHVAVLLETVRAAGSAGRLHAGAGNAAALEV